jgi:flagellar biosynthetic protein FlhB
MNWTRSCSPIFRSFCRLSWTWLWRCLLASAAVMIVIGVADYLYQRHRWFERQKMTVKEVRDEYKQQEGDPTVKAKLRQVRMERSRKRMMAAVPDATVVVTNPTHFAVALKYESGMNAPLCVAKGVDAWRCRSARWRANMKSQSLRTRRLPAHCMQAWKSIRSIPAEHFEAVAKVIGFVMRMREKRSARL